MNWPDVVGVFAFGTIFGAVLAFTIMVVVLGKHERAIAKELEIAKIKIWSANTATQLADMTADRYRRLYEAVLKETK